MNLSFFIANQISGNKQKTFSKFILRLSTVATAISVAVMIVAMAVVQGFKTKIREKMFVFWGHAQVSMFNPNPGSLIGDNPFDNDPKLISEIQSVKGVTGVFPFILKPAIIKAESGLEGIKLKGVDKSYPLLSNDAIRFEGKPLSFKDSGYSSQIILSQKTLDRLSLKIGSSVMLVFFNPEQSSPSVRKLQITGSFHTGMEEVDQGFAFCDIALLRTINNWAPKDVSALQVVMDDYNKAETYSENIYQQYIQPPMNIATIKDIYPFLFSWLDFQDVNAALILVIMSVVAAINMATGLLIYILERTQMVGTLKAIGMRNRPIQKIFLVHAFKVTLKGIICGTVIGLLLCLLQDQFHLLKLNEEIYYVKAAPVAISWWRILLVDMGTLAFCMLVMFIPVIIIRRINIVKALKFK